MREGMRWDTGSGCFAGHRQDWSFPPREMRAVGRLWKPSFPHSPDRDAPILQVSPNGPARATPDLGFVGLCFQGPLGVGDMGTTDGGEMRLPVGDEAPFRGPAG